MPHEKIVKDLMIPIDEYSTVSASAPMRDAVMVLKDILDRAVGHRAALVLDNGGGAVGVLTFRDLVKALEPYVLSADIPQASIDWLLDDISPEVYPNGLFAERSQAQAKKSVREFLGDRGLITVEAQAPVLKAVHLMAHHSVGCLPVLDGTTVVGMIQINEVFREIANVALAAKEG